MTSSAKPLLMEEKILIIDKQGDIGFGVAKHLSKKNKVVLVSEQKAEDNILHIPYSKRISSIPKDTYSIIILIFNGEKEILEVLPQFISDASDSRAKLFFCLPLRRKEVLNKIKVYYKNFFTVYLGQVFGSEFDNQNIVNRFLQEAKYKERIILEGYGLAKIYPIFLDDVVLELLKLIDRKTYDLNIFLLFPKHITQLSFARIIQKINPLIKINFSKEDKNEELEVPKEAEYLIANYALGNIIRDNVNFLFLQNGENKATAKEQKINFDFDKREKKKKKNFIRFIITVVVLVLIIPFVSIILFSLLGFFNLNLAKEDLTKGNLYQAQKKVYSASFYFDLAKNSQKVFDYQASLINKEGISIKLAKNIDTGKEISIGIIGLLNSAENIIKVSAGASKNPKEDFINASNSLKNSIVSFQKIKTDDNSIIPKSLLTDKKITDLTKYITSTIDIMPEILGFNGEKKYLVLFQNNMELRPGGGFIGSYGFLTFNNGKVKDFSIQDVYDADGQLKGHVEPPFAIRRYIPIVHWYLRDSNFDVDFTKNASNAAFFVNAEKGDVVDGVIGVDITFLKDLLNAIGPITVTDYSETVNSDNLYMITQSHVEKNNFPGSSQKKDFLRSLFNALVQNLSARKDIPYLKIAESIDNSIAHKHVLMAFSSQSIQSVFTINNMSSSLWDNREKSNGTINDFLGVNEANLGVNKANYFIKRKISQDVLIDETGKVSEKATVYNMNESSVWPGGDYKNYLRLILPLGSKITKVMIDDQEIETINAVTDFTKYEAKNFKPPKELEIEETQENEKSIFGFLVTIPQGKLKKVSVFYDLPQKVHLGIPASFYNNKVFKQPGTEDDQYSFSLSYPASLKTYNLDKSFKDDDGRINIDTKLAGDMDFKINFARK